MIAEMLRKIFCLMARVKNTCIVGSPGLKRYCITLVYSDVTGSKSGQMHFQDFSAQILTWISLVLWFSFLPLTVSC